jgi:hypothetical protein
VKLVLIDVVFCTDYGYHTLFAFSLSFYHKNPKIKVQVQKFCLIFYDFFVIVANNKGPCTCFSVWSNISKDAEFQGLSEYVFHFLGQLYWTRIEPKY